MLARPVPKTAKLGILSLIALLVLAAVLLPMAKAVSAPPHFTIKGTVTNIETDRPIAGAKVGDGQYAEGKQWTTTDPNGNYSYQTWYEEHNIKCEASGYKTQNKGFGTKLFGSEKEKTIDFQLEPQKASKESDFNAGPQWVVSDRIGNQSEENYALKFDGLDDYVKIPPNPTLDIRGSLTLSAWVKNHGDKDGQIIWRGDNQGGKDPYELHMANGRMEFRIDAGRDRHTSYKVRSRQMLDENWHCWTGTYDKQIGKIHLYKDGILDNSADIDQEILYDTSSMWNTIGAVDFGNWQHFNGIIDEISIWNVARTQQQIKQDISHGLRGNEPNLIAYWKFDEGSGQTLCDLSANHNDGQLNCWMKRTGYIPTGKTNIWTKVNATTNEGLEKIRGKAGVHQKLNEDKKEKLADINAKKKQIVEKLVTLNKQRDRLQRDLDVAERLLREVCDRWDNYDLEERSYPHPITERLNRLQREKDDLVLEISQRAANMKNLEEKGDDTSLIKAEEHFKELQARLKSLENMLEEAEQRKRDLDLARIQYKQRAAIRDERLQRLNELKSQVEKLRIVYDTPETFDFQVDVKENPRVINNIARQFEPREQTKIKGRSKPAQRAKMPPEQNPLNEAVYKQLNQVVDLSGLTSDMSFKRALDELKNSVSPPLRIVVLWQDLFDNADIEQTTPISVDAIPSARLGTALKVLLKSASNSYAEELDYVVEDGVIYIATIESLPAKFQTRVYDVSDLIDSENDENDIAGLIIHTVEPDRWQGVGGSGTVATYNEKLVVYQTREIHRKIQNLLQDLQDSSQELKGLARKERVEKVVEHPEEIVKAAEQLFEKICNADYERISGYYKDGKWKREGWKKFPTYDCYMVRTDYPSFVLWCCETFKNNPIESVELGKVFIGDEEIIGRKGWPTVPYKLTLKNKDVLEGNLAFQYRSNDGVGHWHGMEGIDWHLQ